jgi:hypothetical protein
MTVLDEPTETAIARPTPQRRATDTVSTASKVIDRTAFVVTLTGLTAFVYQLASVLHEHSVWQDFQGPAGVGELLMAIVYGLVAVGGALGLNLQRFVKGLQQ